MKKTIVVILTAMAIFGATAGVATLAEQTPHHYQLYVVKSGDTLDDIILKANQESDVSFDVRDAESYSLSESKKMEGGATSRQLQIGDKVAIPIYR